MSFLKSIAVPVVAVGAICAVLALSRPEQRPISSACPWMGGEILTVVPTSR